MRRLVLGLLAFFALASGAQAQSCGGTPNANTLCAGPSSGGAGFPGFRAQVNADLPTSPANSVKGSIAGGAPTDLTATQLTTLCNVVTGSLKGCVPSFPNTVTTFFRGDGTYNVPPTVTSGAPGYAPAFPNNATTFFRGDGTYTTVSPGALTTGTRGSILEQGAGGWAPVSPGTSGLPWVSNGTGVDPAYQALTAAGIAAATITTTQIAAGAVANSNLANMAAGTVKANPTGSSAAPIDWAIAASSSVEGTGVNGLDNTQFFIYSAPVTSATPQPQTLRVDRNVNYTGGTIGNVYNAVWGNVTVGANVANFEWAVLGQLANSATAGQNVAVVGYANKITSTTGPTWGGNFSVDDNSGAANPTKGAVGSEIDNYANGTDNNSQRVVLDLVGGKHGLAGTTPTITWGWRVGAQNGTLANATFVHGGYFNTATYTDLIKSDAGISTTNGIDLSAGTFSGNPFKSTGFSIGNTGAIAGTTISLNGTTAISGAFSTGSAIPVISGGASVSKPGTLTTIGTWLSVVINGTQYWVPAWSN